VVQERPGFQLAGRFRRLQPRSIGLLVGMIILGIAALTSAVGIAHPGAHSGSPSTTASAHPTAAGVTPAPQPQGGEASSSEKWVPSAAPHKPSTKHPSRAPRAGRAASTPTHASSTPPSRAKDTPAKYRGTVYLTFDDGPSIYTPAILDILRSTHSTATFFELGIRQAEHPAAAAEVRAQGSGIGNHTYDHSDLTALTRAQIRWELAHGPRSRCVRPPYGATDVKVRRILTQQRLREVLWTVDTRDWSRPGVKKIVEAATGATVRAGSIVLMHDGGGNRSQTVAALPQIIATLHQRGYDIRRIPGC
jgi:peptidoglycan-N-acetylglucosamine deacetylase